MLCTSVPVAWRARDQYHTFNENSIAMRDGTFVATQEQYDWAIPAGLAGLRIPSACSDAMLTSTSCLLRASADFCCVEGSNFFGSSSHGTSTRVLWGLDYPWRYASHRDSVPGFQRPQALHVIRCGMSVIAVPGRRRKRNYVVEAGAVRLGCAWVEWYVGMNAMPGFMGSSDHMNSWKRATYYWYDHGPHNDRYYH
jgi:hypothetical protein